MAEEDAEAEEEQAAETLSSWLGISSLVTGRSSVVGCCSSPDSS